MPEEHLLQLKRAGIIADYRIIGKAVCLLGDCLDVLPHIGGIDSVVTDPPYSSGGRQQQSARNTISKSTRRNDEWLLTDMMGSDSYVRWMRQIAGIALEKCTPGSHAYVFTDWRQYTNLVTAWESKGWGLRSVIVWDKNRGGAMGSFWRNNHEWICVFTKGKHRPLPHHSFYNTWRGMKPQGGIHPTVKPDGLIKYLVEASGQGTVFDPFMGSGTTGVAALLSGNNFIGIECERHYFDMACERIENAATGNSPTG